MQIRVLDAGTVGRIAAGEVVERPGSVVKELMENSIDAGASAITVEIRGGGIDYLRVTDNGCGIEPAQVRIAFANHATSKIQNADQLDSIETLGFRGEALPSIASVSRVEMTTRAKGQDSGVKLQIDGGEDIRVKEVGCPQGTTIVVRDLFYNVPVRKAFMKKASYEGGIVGDTVARIILGNPGIAVRYINNGANVYHSFGDGELRHAVFSIYGKETAESMTALDASNGGMRIHGLIGVGDLAKSTRAHQVFFINGRAVRCTLLSRALEEVCRSRVTIGTYPMCVLNIIIPPTAVNVNVHPNKLEVRFKDESMIRDAALQLLNTAFAGERVLDLDPDRNKAIDMTPVKHVRFQDVPSAGTVHMDNAMPAPQILKEREDPIKEGEEKSAFPMARIPQMRSVAEASTGSPPRERSKESQLDMFQQVMQQEIKKLENVRGNVLKEDVSVQVHAGTDPLTPQNNHSTVDSKKTAGETEAFPSGYRLIGTVLNTYILMEANDALILIDQHAAHERLQYEKLLAQLEIGQGSQQLLTPLIIRVSAREMSLIQDNIDLLKDAGYDIEPFGAADIQVRAVPFILGRAEMKPVFMDTINALNRVRNATVDQRRAEIMQMACKSAVKGGDSLSRDEIEALIRQMLQTGAPPTCPHGRPVMKAMARKDLEKLFKRIQ
ncbi:MAG: DNA mismatch repair endonuclease MutL [Clostridia bacterium]|nr:DNA mismatch repair endonuclease MutL [Clostridia bacterium]